MTVLEKFISALPNGATVRVFFEDTMFNDFFTLAKTVCASISSLDLTGRDISIFTAMIPESFYRQLVPRASIDLGMSWSSLNYLESVPDVTIDATAPPATFMVARREVFAAAGSKDIIKFLRLRATEIRQGGYFIAAIGGQKPASASTPTNTGFMPVQSALLKMVKMGALSRADLTQLSLFPTYERTLEEVQEALDNCEVAPLWQVDKIESKLIEHPAWGIYQAALQAANGNESQEKAALRGYANAVVSSLVSAAGWWWVDVLRKSIGGGWTGGEAFLETLVSLAVEECMKGFSDMKVEIWYHYVKLKRTSVATAL
ncbi:KP-43 peptidase, serine peptidase, MEROPS family S08A [Purpureocillium lavendulum]|uniref:KP-43 peptidase, serine peptidase, MEROPS family S08A n=1 Tax=Purpureocillium lavendulum TaxID=1247861 RepID=A0AB34FI69_9HYPO|nr:KP-43 peptidase, serine peptidase, MEROPS family S08A [Purpureocillium lavendulum]